MNAKKKMLLALSILIFSIGVLIGMALFGGLAWADFEATLFDLTMTGNARLRTLKCPVMITTTEEGLVTADFKNPLERPVQFSIRAHISEGFLSLMREVNTRLPVDPGETKIVEWPVTAEDAAYGRAVFVRVRLHSEYPLPSRIGTCGILVLDAAGLNGEQAFALILGASFLSMLAGLGLWVAAYKPMNELGKDMRSAMTVLIVFVLVGILLSALGLWLVGAIIMVTMIMLIGAILMHFYQMRA